MFDTIILVTGDREHAALSAALLGHNPQLVIRPITAPSQFAALDADELARSRLIAFATPLIVPAQVIDGLGFGAYNFHPGPPRYPGWAPAHFALYEQASEFGATAHVMVDKVDAGPIVSVVRFAIPSQIDAAGLEGLAYAHLARLFWNLAEPLACASTPLPVSDVPWNSRKYSRRAYRAICEIPLDIDKEDLQLRLRVFGANHFGVAPTIRLHGVEFKATLTPEWAVNS
ncbi:formyltransferase family protein [Bradyrhizobium sp. Tv2a-2]|uniref:formyltransferase family protein n=1 Tax=Bradyrhizobium sp. Tv2a-2 TaxID=113395 RepID=UPI00042768C4|nr:formyltransferase family protein [Bradyrhizobium sp. Tv2a-2]